MNTFDTFSKLWEEQNKVKVPCKHCGRKMFLIPKKGYAICDWCGHRINSKRNEFKEKIIKYFKERRGNKMSEETKCYVFTCDASCTVKVVVYAKDLDTAHQNCNLLNCDDYEIKEIQIEDIKDYRNEEE